MMRRPLLPLFLGLALLVLAACESREERAERFYQSALALMEAGDTDRALVELRNVFRFNGFHKEARQLYADTQLARGEVQEAYSQYLRLIEQYPDTADVRLTLAEIAVGRGEWEEVERHGRAALALVPDDPRARAVGLALDYRAAVLAADGAARAQVAEGAQALLAGHPDNQVARRIVIDHLAAGEDLSAALAEIDAALALEPDSLEFNVVKFRLLAASEDRAAAGAQLEAMFARFPDNAELRQTLIAWSLAEEDFDRAEELLRQVAGDPTGPVEGHATLVQFLRATRGPEAARAELETLVAANEGSERAALYRALGIALDYDQGDRAGALAAMEALLAGAEPSDQTRRMKIMYAQMLQAEGNALGARAQVEAVLAEDATHVEALKMRAAWRIAADDPDGAVNDLRAALSQAPRDAEVMTLLAEAHERQGAPELAAERLALAVEVSGGAPDMALRYARFLLRDGRVQPAVAVLQDSRARNPGSVELLSLLGEIWVGQQDWTNVAGVIAELEAADSAEAAALADNLRAAVLLGQNRVDETLALIEGRIAAGEAGRSAPATLALIQLRAGRVDEARTYLDGEIAADPDNLELRLIRAAADAQAGDPAAAETGLRAILAVEPGFEAAVELLYKLLESGGRSAEAGEVLAAALAARPDSPFLRWIEASRLEQAGDVEGALAVYEALYAADSSNTVVANNLASLIATHRTDPEELARAAGIARRLRGLPVPAFQDTYGWTQYLEGNHAEAVANLEPAAAGLPDDPLVQYHLGMAYAAVGRREEAIAQLTRALEIAGDSPLPQFDIARETLATLAAAPEEAPAEAGESAAEAAPATP